MIIETIILGNKLILVPYSKSHVPKYHDWMQNDDLLEKTASERLSLEQEYEMQQKWFNDEDKCTFIILAKETLNKTQSETDSMIGDVNLFFKNPEDKKEAEIEVMIAEPSYRGCGMGKEAVLAMMYFGHQKLEVDKFVAIIGNSNKESISLFKKLGFTKIKETTIFDESTFELKITDDVFGQKYFKEVSLLNFQRCLLNCKDDI